MMGSASRRALYAGVCADLEKRVWEHKNGLGGDFIESRVGTSGGGLVSGRANT
jgi:predicted GIY-YIG superfamily endonuclease